MTGETAFFEFGTNVQEPVAEIIRSLDQLHSSLGAARGGHVQLGITEAIAQAREQMTGLFRDLPGKGQFEAQFREIGVSMVRGIESAFSGLNLEQALSSNATEQIRAIATQATRGLIREAEALRAQTPGAKGYGVNFSSLAQTAGAANLSTESRAVEALASAIADADAKHLSEIGAQNRALAEQLGLLEKVQQVLNRPASTGSAGVNDRGAFYSSTYTDAVSKSQQRAAEAADRQTQSLGRTQAAAQRLNEQYDRVAAGAANAARLADELARGTARMYGPNLIRSGNDFFAKSAAGWHELEAGSIEYLSALNRVNSAQNQASRRAALQNATPLEAFGRGLTSHGGLTGVAGFADEFGRVAAGQASWTAIAAAMELPRQVFDQYSEAQKSLQDLQVAVGKFSDGTSEGTVINTAYAESLAQISRMAGENVAASYDSAAAGVRAFGEEVKGTGAQATRQVQEIGTETARAAAMLAVVADKPQQEATSDLIAVGTAYKLQADQLGQVVDAIANAKRNVGGDATQISKGMASIAEAAQTAGYSLSDTAALIGLVQSHTGEGGATIATQLTRVFQIASGSTGANLARSLSNYDFNNPSQSNLAAYKAMQAPNASVKARLEGLAAIYGDTNSQSIRDQITSQIGGTNNLKALLPLLQDNTQLQKAFADALNNTGQGVREYDQKMQAVVGTLKLLRGDVDNIAVDLADSGLLTFFGLLLKGIEPVAHGIDGILQLLDRLPASARGLLGLTATAGAAAALVGKVRLAGATDPLAAIGGGFLGGGAKASAALTAASSAQLAAQARLAAAQTEAATIIAAEGAESAAATAAAERVAVAQNALAVASERAAAALGVEAAVAGEATAATGLRGALGTAGGKWGRLGGRLGIGAAEGAGVAAGAGLGATLGTGAAGILGTLLAPEVVLPLLAIGAIGLYGHERSNRQQSDAMQTLADQSLEGVRNRLSYGNGATYTQSATDLRSTAGDIMAGKNGGDAGLQRQLANELTARANELDVIGKAVQQEQAHAAALQRTTVFGGQAISTVQQLADGMESMSKNGVGAIDQFETLLHRLQTPPASSSGGGPRGPLWGKTTAAGGILNALDEAGFTTLTSADGSRATSAEDRLNAVLGQFGAVGMSPHKQPTATQLRTLFGRLTSGDLATTNPAAYGMYAARGLPVPEQYLAQGALRNFMDHGGSTIFSGGSTLFGKSAINGVSAGALNSSTLNPKQILAVLNAGTASSSSGQKQQWQGIEAYYQNAIQDAQAANDTAKVRQLQQKYLSYLTGLKKRNSGKDISQLDDAIAAASNDYATSQLQYLDQLRLSAEQRSKDEGAFASIRMRYAKMEVKAVGDNVPLLTQLFAELDRQTVDAIVQSTNNALAAARAAAAMSAHVLAEAQAAADAAAAAGNATMDTAGIGVAALNAEHEGRSDDASKQLHEAQQQANAVNQAKDLSAQQYKTPQAAYAAGPGKPSKGHTKTNPYAGVKDAKAQAHEAKLQIAAAADGGEIAQANAQEAAGKVALDRAKVHVDKAKKGTTAYYQALASLYQAKAGLAQDEWSKVQALAAYQSTLDQLATSVKSTLFGTEKADFTDPVQQAKAALQAAQQKQKLDVKHHAGKDTKASDKLAVAQASSALAQAQFSQNLADEQTAYQLQEISYSTYVSWLQRQSSYFHSMKTKTRQQIDDMNQVDQALRDAQQSMDGVFNMGAIDTNGLIYQVRALKALNLPAAFTASSAASTAPVSVVNSNNTVTINGADTAAVKQVLITLLSSATATTQSTTYQK